MLYLVRIILIQSFLFVGVFFIVLLSFWVKEKRMSKILISLLTVLLHNLTYFLIIELGWHGTANGRYILIGFLTYYFGWITAIPMIIYTGIQMYLLYPEYVFGNMIICIVMMFGYIITSRLAKDKFAVTSWQLVVVNSLMPTIISLPLSNLFYTREGAVSLANTNFLFLLGSSFVYTVLIFMTISNEFKKNNYNRWMIEKNRHLEQSNEAIRELNRSLQISEKSLKSNYHQLEKYRVKVEKAAYYEERTGYYSKKYLLELLGGHESSDLANVVLVYLKLNMKEATGAILDHEMLEYHRVLGKIIEKQLYYYRDQIMIDMVLCGYALYLKDLDDDAIKKTLQSVKRALAQASSLEKLGIESKLSIGAVRINRIIEDTTQWIYYAELSMLTHQLRPNAGIVQWFDHSMLHRREQIDMLKEDILTAVNSNEIQMYYQPIYDRYNQVISIEHKFRWHHHSLGYISDEVLSDVLINNPIMKTLGAYIIDRAVQSIRLYSEQIRMPLLIRVADAELKRANYAFDFIDTVSKQGIPFDKIHIAFHNSLINDDEAIRNLELIKECGVNLCIIGFPDWNNLAYIRISSIIDYIKVDMKNFDDVCDNPLYSKVLRTKLEMIHNFDLKLIVSDIDDSKIFDKLKQYEIDYFQGEALTGPLSENLFIEFLIEIRDSD